MNPYKDAVEMYKDSVLHRRRGMSLFVLFNHPSFVSSLVSAAIAAEEVCRRSHIKKTQPHERAGEFVHALRKTTSMISYVANQDRDRFLCKALWRDICEIEPYSARGVHLSHDERRPLETAVRSAQIQLQARGTYEFALGDAKLDLQFCSSAIDTMAKINDQADSLMGRVAALLTGETNEQRTAAGIYAVPTSNR